MNTIKCNVKQMIHYKQNTRILFFLCLSALPAINAMQEASSNLKSLKELCLDRILVSDIPLERADCLLCTDLKNEIREKIIQSNLLLIVDICRPLTSKQFTDTERHFIWTVGFTPNGRYILAGTLGDKAYLWDLNQPSDEPIAQLNGSLFTFSDDGNCLLTGKRDGSVSFYNLQRTPLTEIILWGHGSEIKALAFCSDSSRALSADGNSVVLWSIAGVVPGVLAIYRFPTIQDAIVGVTFSSDNKTALICSRDYKVYTWDTDQHPPSTVVLRQLRCENTVTFSPCKRLLLNASDNKTAQIWSLYEPNKTETVLSGHTNYVNKGVFSSDGRYVLTCSYDQTARLWDISKKRVESVVLFTDSDVAMSVAINPNGTQFLVATMAKIYLLDIVAATQGLTLAQMQLLIALQKKPELIENLEIHRRLELDSISVPLRNKISDYIIRLREKTAHNNSQFLCRIS